MPVHTVHSEQSFARPPKLPAPDAVLLERHAQPCTVRSFLHIVFFVSRSHISSRFVQPVLSSFCSRSLALERRSQSCTSEDVHFYSSGSTRSTLFYIFTCRNVYDGCRSVRKPGLMQGPFTLSTLNSPSHDPPNYPPPMPFFSSATRNLAQCDLFCTLSFSSRGHTSHHALCNQSSLLFARVHLHSRGGRRAARVRMCIFIHQGQLVALCSIFSPVEMCMMDVEVCESRA
ncbi:hypothetical protein BJV77DRAFT_405423 [Russula vinacea]|nr:hypothetical protein BJV77DRAFT_405423 [Russula vinacea]